MARIRRRLRKILNRFQLVLASDPPRPGIRVTLQIESKYKTCLYREIAEGVLDRAQESPNRTSAGEGAKAFSPETGYQ
jgi:hypothetical protein